MDRKERRHDASSARTPRERKNKIYRFKHRLQARRVRRTAAPPRATQPSTYHTPHQMSKRSAPHPQIEASTLYLKPLGAGNEVGRSCLILRFKGLCIMLDCGVLPSFSGYPSLPLLDEIDAAEVDAIIITCVSIPFAEGNIRGALAARVIRTNPLHVHRRLIHARAHEPRCTPRAGTFTSTTRPLSRTLQSAATAVFEVAFSRRTVRLWACATASLVAHAVAHIPPSPFSLLARQRPSQS